MNEADHGHNSELFSRFEGLAFDDVVLVPGFSDVLPDMVDTTSWFTPTIPLNVPLLSAAMDKVTEARLAIAMVRIGGIGVVHRNLTIEAQAAEVQKVKRSQSGMITDPVTSAHGRGVVRSQLRRIRRLVVFSCSTSDPMGETTEVFRESGDANQRICNGGGPDRSCCVRWWWAVSS